MHNNEYGEIFSTLSRIIIFETIPVYDCKSQSAFFILLLQTQKEELKCNLQVSWMTAD